MIKPLEGTLTGTTILGHSGSRSNNNGEVLYILRNFEIEASPSDAF